MCDKTVDSDIQALKSIPDCFAASNMIQKRDGAVFSNDNIVFGDLDFWFSLAMIQALIGLKSITLDDINFDDNDFVIVNQKILVRWDLWLVIIDIGNAKHLKNR